MIWLLIGLLMWSGAHLFKRLAPKVRRGMGDAGKGLVAALSLVAIVLMVIGYRTADFEVLWNPPTWTVHLNNLLMVVAIVLLGLGMSKSRFRGAMRHPMLTGVLLWAVAHLLVNGDSSSIVLFGGLALWAVASMILINRAEPVWKRPPPGTVAGDIRLLAISAAVYAVIVGLHMWLGPSPFPGG